MSKKLTEKSLEKKLHNMGTEELIQIIMSLYRSNKSVEQSINLQIIGDAYGNELLEKYKRGYTKYLIHQILFVWDFLLILRNRC